jgi:hypothetical protein
MAPTGDLERLKAEAVLQQAGPGSFCFRVDGFEVVVAPEQGLGMPLEATCTCPFVEPPGGRKGAWCKHRHAAGLLLVDPALREAPQQRGRKAPEWVIPGLSKEKVRAQVALAAHVWEANRIQEGARLVARRVVRGGQVRYVFNAPGSGGRTYRVRIQVGGRGAFVLLCVSCLLVW